MELAEDRGRVDGALACRHADENGALAAEEIGDAGLHLDVRMPRRPLRAPPDLQMHVAELASEQPRHHHDRGQHREAMPHHRARIPLHARDGLRGRHAARRV